MADATLIKQGNAVRLLDMFARLPKVAAGTFIWRTDHEGRYLFQS